MEWRKPKRTQVYQRLGPGHADGVRTIKCVCATSLWRTIRTASGHGLHGIGIKGRRGLQCRRHGATRSRDHLDVHWTWALGMEARAACVGKISGTGQLTAVAGARSSAAAEVAGIHDCWLVGVRDWWLRVIE